MAGIRVEGGSNISIINCIFDRCDIAVHATNTHNLRINESHINNCEKGIGLYDCWDSRVSNVNIDQSTPKYSKMISRFKLNKLTDLVRYHMMHRCSSGKPITKNF